MNDIQKTDVLRFAESFALSNDLEGASFLITGATGLIGSTLVHCLLSLDKEVTITCPVRDESKATRVLGRCERLEFVGCDLLEYLQSLTSDVKFDYIIHCASPTSGKYMNEHPVETYELAVESTRLLLKYAKNAGCKGVVYVSSLEYYGEHHDDSVVEEDMSFFVNRTDPRSSYPLGKRSAEYLCSSYAAEYGVNVKVARLTQTFGAGVSADDGRVFAQFARSVMAGQDIVLHTTGESAKPYCYTTDCVSAILYILLKGENGHAYNVANEETYISIREMAELLRDEFNKSIKVRVESHPEMGYAPQTKLRLSSAKLMSLGWRPQYGLVEMYQRLIDSFRQ